MPRPTKLTPARQRAIIDTIRAGNYFDTACAAASINPDTGYTWLDRGKTERARIETGLTDEQRTANGDPPAHTERRYAEFSEAVEQARACAEVRVVKFIHKDIEGGWVKEKRLDPESGELVEVTAGPNGRLGLEYLARTSPERFGRRQSLEVSGPEGGPVALDASSGARIAERLREFLDNAGHDPRILEGRVTRRELVSSGGPFTDEDRSVGYAGGSDAEVGAVQPEGEARPSSGGGGRD